MYPSALKRKRKNESWGKRLKPYEFPRNSAKAPPTHGTGVALPAKHHMACCRPTQLPIDVPDDDEHEGLRGNSQGLDACPESLGCLGRIFAPSSVYEHCECS